MIAISESLRQEIEQLKSENARLLTDYRNLRETYSELYNELAKAQSAPMTRAELNDLLAPTIELLENSKHENLGSKVSMEWFMVRDLELARLHRIVK